jgi:ribosomal protein S17E
LGRTKSFEIHKTSKKLFERHFKGFEGSFKDIKQKLKETYGLKNSVQVNKLSGAIEKLVRKSNPVKSG